MLPAMMETSLMVMDAPQLVQFNNTIIALKSTLPQFVHQFVGMVTSSLMDKIVRITILTMVMDALPFVKSNLDIIAQPLM